MTVECAIHAGFHPGFSTSRQERALEDSSQVTLHIAQDLLSHSLFVRLILWSADAIGNRALLTSHRIYYRAPYSVA